MPIYGQECTKCKHTFDDVRGISEVASQPPCPKCKAPTIRDYSSGSNRDGSWPEQLSEALGVHPDQIPEMKKRFPKHEFHPDGRMRIRSLGEHRQVLKDLGFIDRGRH